MRAVLDPNVLISALLTPHGKPAQVVRSWLAGAFELFVSESLLAELQRALGYPKLRALIEATEAQELLDLLRRDAEVIDDPDDPPAIRSPDPDDDYLIALAMSARAALVSGDGHLLGLGTRLPVYAPAEFLALLAQEPGV
ncbi:MAG: putative toxin-antitoxin system toxin component, PIN family [Acidimicrobiia bacterium]|nr:putative toxin-antitoxin system toxin component, PIN family [Acidimicrobiia bacterium]